MSRHGIDLDNPGPNLVSGGSLMETNNAGGCSDSGDSTGARSADNATPPMHFLTPHVEISMTDTPPTSSYSPTPVSRVDYYGTNANNFFVGFYFLW